MIMKKIVYILTLGAIFTACDSNIEPMSNMGEASFNIKTSGVMTSDKESRADGAQGIADETITVDLPEELTVSFVHTGISGEDGSVVIAKSASDQYMENCAIMTGTYDMEAYNYATDALALAANGGRGDVRYHGSKPNVTILDGSTTIIDMNVSITNSMVKITETGFNESKNYTLSEVTVIGSVNGSPYRSVVFNSFDGTEEAWFAVGQELSLKIYFEYQGEQYYKVVGFEDQIVTEAKHCYDVEIRPSESGFGSLTITVDNSLTVTTADIYFDPMDGIPVTE
ncbi:MAG: DUF4493 domain-containing protein [Bacteroidales bacterium]|nr:DUF4493 domain-containing protein [Bacteroidales bacterium]